jgi:transcriptional regulator with XRE-family HTH domain
MHISQIRRYESGQSQPTLDAIRKLALALRVSADMLLFEKDERGSDEDLKLQFELWRGWTRRRRESSDL